jgi:hypothetical protein
LVEVSLAKKQTPKVKVLYHAFFCGDVIGEADGFFEITKGKVKYVTGWFCNDAMWRGEYMTDLIEHFGGKIEDLPEEHLEEAENQMAEAYGLV